MRMILSALAFLIPLVSEAQTLPGQSEILTSPRSTSLQPLLFNFVASINGFDTEITISNTSQDTLGTTPQSGTCKLTFYANNGIGSPSAQTSSPIAAGTQLVFMLSQGGGGIAGAPNFYGYIIANCTFPLARGSARSYYDSRGSLAEDAQLLTLPRSVSSINSILIPYVTNKGGFDAGISIANTSADPFGTIRSSGSCKLYFYSIDGTNPTAAPCPNPNEGGNLPYQAGETYAFTLTQALAQSQFNPSTFSGYIIVQCFFSAPSVFVYQAYLFPTAASTTYSVPTETIASRGSSPQSLLFSSVTNQNGSDTSIVIANTSSDPIGSLRTAGTCTLNFYGPGAPAALVTPNIASGTSYVTPLSAIAPGFKGYITATCAFSQARGLAEVLSGVVTNTYSEIPDALPTPRTSSTPSHLLLSHVTNWNANDTNITISNTSLDTFGTPVASGSCTITYFGTMTGGGNPPAPQVSSIIPAGGQLSFTLSQGNAAQGIAGAPGFRGYITADCGFPLARGVAAIMGTPAGLIVTNLSVPAGGTVGTAYSQTLAAANGVTPYNTWTIASGLLPPGLTLNAVTGTIAGTPTTSVGSPFTFAVTVNDSGGNVSAARSLSIAISQTAQTLVFGTLSSVTFGVAPFVISATASSGLAASFASTTSAVCTVSATTVTVIGAGTCSIIASQAGNATYSAALSVTQSFTVDPGSQTITFAALSNVSLGASTLSVSATATSGLTVTFTSNTTSICTVSSVTVTLPTAGTCSITASQPGNATYAPAPSVTRTFTVSPAVATPAFFNGQVSLGGGVNYLQFPNGTPFGYYNPNFAPFMFHYDLGFLAFIDPKDGTNGAYLFDNASGHWFYTSASVFPNLYDFTLNAWLYYFPDTSRAGHYTTNPRYFVNLTTKQIFTM